MHVQRRARLGLYLSVFFGIFFLLLLLGGSTQPYNDGAQIFAHAENLVYKGEFGISKGSGPKFYNPRPALVSLIHVPDVLLRRTISTVYPAADAYTRIITSHIVPAALTGLTCLLFVRFVLALGVGLGVASLSAVLLGSATFLFVFGRVVWSDIAQATAFWGFFSELILTGRNPSRRAAVKIGVWAGLLINTKYLFALSIPGAVVYLLLQLRKRVGLREIAIMAGWAVLVALPLGILIAWHNYVRNGTIFHLGYGPDEPFQESLFWGFYSLLFSFGKGLFLYNPVLLFALHNKSRLPDRWWTACALVAGPVVLLYGKYSNWGGDWSWGPRYLIYLVPVLMVPVAVLLDDLVLKKKRVLLAVFGCVAACSIFVQLLGAGLYWDHYIRLSKAASHQWLGQPNRSGSYTPDWRGGDCSPCFEDLYGHTYLPAFQPIEGHYWILKHSLLGHTWDMAVVDAPWRRYTRLPLEVTKAWYPWPKLDFWYIFLSPRFPSMANLLLGFFIVGLSGACALWIWALRRMRGMESH